MATPASIQNVNGVTSNQLVDVTQPLVDLQQTGAQFANFPPEVYDLTPNSNIVRFMRTLLGDAGVAQLRKRLNLARLKQTLQSSNFYDLDSFYGDLFNIRRNANEVLQIEGATIDPSNTLATQDQWRSLAQADAAYKNRLFQFGQAISYGPTALGMKSIAEAILGQQVFISEVETANLSTFTINPIANITLEQSYNLKVVLDVLKPGNTTFTINTQGLLAQALPIILANAWSDSSYWEIDASTTISGTTSDNQRPPFNSYAGEQWYYNHDITGSLSYTSYDLVTSVAPIDYERIFWADGTYTDFVSSNAILPWYQTILGRYSQDGMMSVNILAGTTDGLNAPTLSPLYFDGISASDVITEINAENTQNKSVAALDFWCTDNRDQTNPIYDVIEFKMSQVHIANILSFDIAHFPQQALVQYYDLNASAWVTISTHNILDSVPTVLDNSDQYLQDKIHPQHNGNGHWYNISVKTLPFKASNIRIALIRIPGQGPVTQSLNPYPDADGNLPIVSVSEPYSLGVRKFKVGYTIQDESDLPIAESGTVIDTSNDIVGNSIAYKLYQELPSNPIQSSPSTWRCGPQPVNNAVVNYVIDTRGPDGKSQTIDTLFINPTHVGVHANLYYSNEIIDAADSTYQANDSALIPPLSVASSSVTTNSNGIQFPVTANTPGDVTIANSAIQLDINNSWWCGINFQVDYLPSSGILPLLDLLGNVLYYDCTNQQLTFNINGANVSIPLAIQLYSQISIIVGYSNGEISFDYQVDTLVAASQSFPLTQSESPTDFDAAIYDIATYDAAIIPFTSITALSNYIVVGGIDVGEVSTTNPSGMFLYNMVLKSEPLSADTVTGFFTDPQSYCYKGAYRSSYTDSNTNNAILRFDPSFITATNPTGFVGGPTSFFPDLNWNPIPGDFILSAGNIEIQPLNAKFIKFEMTNLVAEPYEGFMPVSSTVKTFGVGAVNSPPNSNSLGPIPAGQTTLLGLNLGENLYGISGTSSVQPTTASANLVVSPTSASIANDPAYAQLLSQASQSFSYSNYHQGQSAPRFSLPGQHQYQESIVGSTNKVAYFCGFNQIAASRTNINALHDTPIYYEYFFDNVDLSSTGSWSQQNGQLSSPGFSEANLLPAIVQSNTYFSHGNVSGIQFAAQQSEPVEVVYDDNFSNTSLINSTWTNTSSWNAIGDLIPNNISYNNETITLLRNTGGNVSTTPLHGDIKPLVGDVLGSIGKSSANSNAGYGGLASAPFLLSPAGRAWIAVRMIPRSPISSPWYIQLRDFNTGSVVWESEVQGLSQGQITEFYDAYDIGSGVWQETNTNARLIANESLTAPLTVAIVQKGESRDIVEIDRLSVFDESVFWEFSNDNGVTFFPAINVRNNPTGVLDFPVPNNQLVWKATAYRTNVYITALQLRPVYSALNFTYIQPNITGPNLQPIDLAPAIGNDPQFQTWQFPIPRWWFLAYSSSIQLFPNGVNTNQYSQYVNDVLDEILPTFGDTLSRKVIRHVTLQEAFTFSDSAGESNGFYYRNPTSTLPTFSDSANAEVLPPPYESSLLGNVVQGHKQGVTEVT